MKNQSKTPTLVFKQAYHTINTRDENGNTVPVERKSVYTPPLKIDGGVALFTTDVVATVDNAGRPTYAYYSDYETEIPTGYSAVVTMLPTIVTHSCNFASEVQFFNAGQVGPFIFVGKVDTNGAVSMPAVKEPIAILRLMPAMPDFNVEFNIEAEELTDESETAAE
jgi:hypothetical protein